MKKITSIILVLVLVVSFASCMKVNITLPEVNVGGAQNVNGTVAENTTRAPEPVVTLPEITTVAVVPEATTAAPVVEQTTAAPVIEQTTAAPAVKTPLEMTDDELLEWFNLSVNNVKEGMPGFQRAKQTTVADIVLSNKMANTLVGFVKGMLLSEEVETASSQKGESCVEMISPTGERYVSQLNTVDIKDISVISQGTSYVVTVTMPDEVNPTKDTSAYAKIFNFVTVDDVMNVYAPKVGATVERSNVKVTYKDCTAKATISPDGRVEEYNTYVTCVVELKGASIEKGVTISTDVEFTLVSTADYTNFVY